MKHLLISILSFCLFFNVYAQPKQEIRAVWLTTNYALDWPKNPAQDIWGVNDQKRELDEILDKLKEANFNMVFLQVRLRGDVIYPSEFELRSSYIQHRSFQNGTHDILQYAIEACHKRGLECHAWFVVYPIGPEKINKKSNSNPAVTKNRSIIRTFNGGLYLDPGEPETTTYLLKLIRELVYKYDIDGLHFDYLRYPDKSEKFPDDATFRKYGKGKSKANWRRDNINQFVYKAYDLVKEMKPWVQVSSSVVGMHSKIPGNNVSHWAGYTDVYQDASDWMQKGKHDFVVPMMYYNGKLFYPFVSDWLSKSNERFVVPGLAVYRMDPSESNWNADVITDQIEFSRENGVHGNAFYRTKHLFDNSKGLWNLIKTKYYTEPALLPPLTWMNADIPKPPAYIEALPMNNYMFLTWEDQGKNVFYNIYRSRTSAIDITNPKNLIATRLKGNKCRIPSNTKTIDGYYYVVTSYDRYHQESAASPSVFFINGDIEK